MNEDNFAAIEQAGMTGSTIYSPGPQKVAAALKVICPECESGPQSQCTRPDRSPLRGTVHKGRVDLAEELAVPVRFMPAGRQALTGYDRYGNLYFAVLLTEDAARRMADWEDCLDELGDDLARAARAAVRSLDGDRAKAAWKTKARELLGPGAAMGSLDEKIEELYRLAKEER